MNTFPSWPHFSEEEANAARDVILSNRVNQWTGDKVRNFETAFAEWANTRHAVAVTNGTLALELALRAANVGPGDEVIVPARSFFASASCVVAVGAKVVFADVELDSGNVSAATIEPCLSNKTKAIVVVHIAGWPADMAPIMEFAARLGLKVIEDCAQAHGASIDGKPVGSIGDYGAWSFCQDKNMTTGGEGGMVTTNDALAYEKMWSYKDHGKSREAVFNRIHPPGFRWLHENFGTNWRMLEIQAAIGLIQLDKIEEWTQIRARNARALASIMAKHDNMISAPMAPDGSVHAFYRFYAYIKPAPERDQQWRDALIGAINDRGFPAFHGTCSEMYQEEAFTNTDMRPKIALPNAHQLGTTSIMLLTHPTIGEESLEAYCNALDQVLTQFASI